MRSIARVDNFAASAVTKAAPDERLTVLFVQTVVATAIAGLTLYGLRRWSGRAGVHTYWQAALGGLLGALAFLVPDAWCSGTPASLAPALFLGPVAGVAAATMWRAMFDPSDPDRS